MALELNVTNKIVHDNLNNDIRTLLQPKNWIINGMFDVWQRGTSQTSSGYGSDDRWSNNVAGATQTVSRQAFTLGQTTVPNNPKYFSRTVVVDGGGVGTTVEKIHKIEDVTKFSSKTLTISFWAKADANKNMSLEVYRYYGVGGSGYDLGIVVQKVALTTSWQRFTKTFTLPSVSGKTIGENSATHVSFWFDAGSNYASRTDSLGNQSGTFDIANVSLVEGSVAVECQNQPYADVLRDCQRYYRRYGATSPYTQFGNTGYCASATEFNLSFVFDTPMRITPTMSYYGLIVHDIHTAFRTITSITLDATSSPERARLKVYSTSLTQFKVSDLVAQDATSFIEFSAEL